MFIYLSKLDRRANVLWLQCPACSEKVAGDLDDFFSNNWVAACPRCGAVYGHVPPERFGTYVSKAWRAGGGDQPVYVDFLIVDKSLVTGNVSMRRWHGWVDPETREIVQEG